MLIDWFTVGAQVLNFLILVWLLKRFLYKPILNAIDVREKRIAGEVADADAKKADAQKSCADLEKKNKAFDDQRGGLLNKASEDAKAERDRLIALAEADVGALRAAQTTALRNERIKLGNQITRLAQDEVFGIVRKTLSDLATVSLEERMGEVFTRRLREMNQTAKATLAVALKTSSQPAILTSTFEIPAEQKAAIQNALNETFSAEIRVRFETAPDTVCGIELTANGQRIAWNIEQYLASLDQKAGALLDARYAPETKAKPQTQNTPTPELAHAAPK